MSSHLLIQRRQSINWNICQELCHLGHHLVWTPGSLPRTLPILNSSQDLLSYSSQEICECPLSSPPLIIVRHRDNPVSDIDSWEVSPMSILKELAFMYCTGHAPWFSQFENLLVWITVITAVPHDPAKAWSTIAINLCPQASVSCPYIVAK